MEKKLAWDTVVGHQNIKNDLQWLLTKQKLPHALLFTGIDGIGKSLMAKLLAKALLCSADMDKPCGACLECRLTEEQGHPDLYVITPEVTKTAQTIKIEQIRNLQAQLAKSPLRADCQVVIIEEAHTLNEASMNALLKTLEEPMGNVIFMLVTAQKERLLPTILSRCTQIYFGPLATEDIVKVITAQRSIDAYQAEIAARLSQGSIGKALSLLDDNLELRAKALRLCMGFTEHEQFRLYVDELAQRDRTEIVQWLIHVEQLIRDLIVMAVSRDEGILYNSDIKQDLVTLQNKYSVDKLLDRLSLIEELAQQLKSNADIAKLLTAFLLKWRE